MNTSSYFLESAGLGLQTYTLTRSNESSYSENLAYCGYQFDLVRNMALPIVILGVMVTFLAATCLLDSITKRKGRRSLGKWMMNLLIRFVYEFSFEMVLCSIVQVTAQN